MRTPRVGIRAQIIAELVFGLTGLALGGCASQTMSMRSLPAETPAADNAAAIEKMAALEHAADAAKAAAAPSADRSTQHAGADGAATPSIDTAGAVTQSAGMTADTPGGIAAGSSAGASPSTAVAPAASQAEPAPPLTPADAPSMRTYDPWERFNRFTYRFNARFDEAIFLPVADGYRRLPSPIRAGVHNFFSNLAEVKTTLNYVVQLKLGAGVKSLTRFVVNSTFGIGGLFDVATKLDLESEPTGFSTTLARWGMHPGPYLVIPILGPSTLRDGIGLLGDYGTSYAVNVANLYRDDQSYALGVVDAVDIRARTNFRYYSTGSPFEYETIRFLYVRKRLIEDEGLHKHQVQARDVAAPAGQ